VIGLDGLEPSIVETMLGRGELPNLARIRKSGSYSRLSTTYPAQTPVAWSSFATGTNPGGHGIFDFISRDPQTYQPDAALSHFERPKNLFAPPRVVNQRKGTALWDLLTKAEIPSTVLRCPCTFPPEKLHGRMLAGVGVPDVRGSQSKGTFYTQDSSVCAREHEQVVLLPSGTDFKTTIIGPRNTKQSPPGDTLSEIHVSIDSSARKLVIETGGNPARIEVEEKSWSQWVRFRFKLSLLQSVSGIARVYVCQIEPCVRFYISAVNFDPTAPLFPVSFPADYAKEISERVGLFSTLGMAEDHNGLENDRFDEAAYLEHCNLVLAERARIVRFELDRFEEGFFFALYDTPDRLQHMMWRFRDGEHPGFESDLARDFANRIEEHYQRCDSLLGPVLEKTDTNTLLIVLSDHGFGSFRRAVDTNTWLWQNGLLALKNNHKPNGDLGEGFRVIDWSKTYAYAVGLGGIYLNLKGRESSGILEEGTDAERARRAIQQGLAQLSDEQKHRPVVKSVARREDLYRGPYVYSAPDLLVNFHPGFRVSWQSAIGGFSDNLIEDNKRRWSGDHIVDPDAVPGILFMNREARRNNASILDLAPTVLSYLGVSAPDTMEGSSLI